MALNRSIGLVAVTLGSVGTREGCARARELGFDHFDATADDLDALDARLTHASGQDVQAACALRCWRACALPTWVITSTMKAKITMNQPKPVTPSRGA